ncbi:MAG: carboxylate--amine ligase [Sphingomonadaceae bacterium]|nr:carboxylate--amine ligase [Sphingomonadaceae bacterium]
MTLNVTILGIDTPIGLTVVRELGRSGVRVHGIGRSASAIGGASRYLTDFSVRGDGPITDWLPEQLAASRADALLAVSEGDLIALAQMPDMIGNCRVLTPRQGPLTSVLDKARTLSIATSVGIDVPQSWQPMPGDDWAARAATLPFPLVAKWADPNALVAPLAAAGLSLDKVAYVADAAALFALRDHYAPIGQWPLLQSYATGFGLGQMLHMADGRATLRFQHRRIHEWPVSGGVSSLCESIEQGFDAQFAKSEALLAAIGWQGPAMVEYRHDPESGKFILMEVNGRFWGSLPLAHAAGAWFAREQIAHSFPDALLAPAPPRRHARARFLVPEARRLLSILRHGGGEGRAAAIANFVGQSLNPRLSHYVWDWRDPMPMLRDMGNMVMRR